MPKQSLEISNFQSGVISNVSERDIPLDAASDSLNIDPNSEQGSLRGINNDTNMGTISAPHSLGIINNDGTHVGIIYEPKIDADGSTSGTPWSYVDDIFGSPNEVVLTVDGTISGTDIGTHEVNPIHNSCMEVNNKEVHIGQGTGPSKWAGIIQYKQFGIDYSASPYNLVQFEDAEVKSPNIFPDMYKVIHIGDYLYGIKWQGHYVYRFKISDYSITKSQKRFKSLQGICAVNGDSNNIWLFDAAETQYGTLYKYPVTLDPDQTLTTVINIPAGAVDKWKVDHVSDILHVTGSDGTTDTDKIWFYRPIQGEDIPHTDLNEGENAYLWNVNEPTSNGSAEITSKTPLFKATDYDAENTTQGQWFGLNGDGMLWKDKTSFHLGNHDELAELKVAYNQQVELKNSSDASIYEAGTSQYNRYATSHIKYDKDSNLLLVFVSDLRNESAYSAGSTGYSYVNVFSVDTDDNQSPESDSVSTYGELTYLYSNAVGHATQHGGPQHTHAAVDTKNKIIFIGQENSGYAYKYTNTELTFVNADGPGDTWFALGSGTNGEVRHMRVDMEERLLFVGTEEDGLRIYHYQTDGTVLNESEKVFQMSGEQNGVALDTEFKLVFIGKYSGTKLQVAKYESPENPDDMNSSFQISQVGGETSLQGSYANSAPTIEVDPINKILFARGRTDSTTGVILESFSYDNTGALTHVDTIKGTTDSTPEKADDYRPFNTGASSVTGLCIEDTNISVDADARIVFPHNGFSITPIPYNEDGSFDGDSISDLTYPNNRVIYRDTNQYNENNVGDGLGFWTEVITPGSDFGAQSKRGIIVYGSNTGIINTRAYSRHTNKVWMPKVGLIKPQGTDADDCVAYPIIMNNSLVSNRGANHIYYIGSDGTSANELSTNGTLTDSASWTAGSGWTYNATDDDMDYDGSTDDATLDNATILTAGLDYVVSFEVKTAALQLTIQGTDGSGNLLETYYAKDTYAVGTHTVGICPAQTASRIRFMADADGDAAVFDTLSIKLSRYAKSQMYWIMVNDTIDPSDPTANAAILDGTVGECVAATSGSNQEAPATLYCVQTNANEEIKVAYTGSTVADGKDLTSLYVLDAAGSDMNPNFDTEPTTRWSYTKKLDGIRMKEACVIDNNQSNADDDQQLELFEGATRGTGKWARVLYDRSDAEFENPNNSASATAGGIISNPIDLEFELIANDDDDEELEKGKGVKKDVKYFYKCSYLYDGYQEGPLGDEFTYIPEEDGNLLITIKLKGLLALPKRVTHLNLYRSETEETSASKPLGYYRLCESIRLDSRWTAQTEETTVNPDWGSYRRYKFLDEGRLFQSFESNAGYSSVLTDLDMRYSLSTQLNNTHFVSNVSHPVLDEEGGNFVIKSLPYKYDLFDYSKDILRIPDKLTALQAFKGRIWAFTDSKIYIIEPNGLYIEDTMIGIGCAHDKGVVVTPYGMFWIDKNNIYLHDGSTMIPIGQAIKDGNDNAISKIDFDQLGTVSEAAAGSGNTAQAPIAVYDANANAVLFIVKLDASPYNRRAWAFHIPSKRWECWQVNGAAKIYDAVTGSDGYVYYIDSRLRKYRGESSRRTYNWASKEITLGDHSNNKHYNSIKITGNNADLSSKLTVKLDGSTVTETFSADGTEGVYKLPYGSRKGKRIKLEFSGLSSTTEVIDSIGITFRMKGAK